jgi:Ras-related C3 botulinum toxin substrate 1
MGRNFDDYPGFQPKITHPKHFCHECRTLLQRLIQSCPNF